MWSCRHNLSCILYQSTPANELKKRYQDMIRDSSKMEPPWLDLNRHPGSLFVTVPDLAHGEPRNFQNSGGNRLWREARGHMRCKTVDTLHSCAGKNRSVPDALCRDQALFLGCVRNGSETLRHFEPRKRPFLLSRGMISIMLIWLVVWNPLKNISQLGWLFPIYGKIKNVPNHQPVI